MINIEKIKEYIKCPQFGDSEYGEWGALRLEQRIAYKELIEEIEILDNLLQQKENIIKEAIEYINRTQMGEGYKKMLLEILDKENK